MIYCMENTKDLRGIALYYTPSQILFSNYYIYIILIYRSNLERNIKNTKQELFLTQISAQLFYLKQWNYILTSPIPLEFFTVTEDDGLSLWEYDKVSEEYNPLQMIAYEQSGNYRRGGMNEEGIYVAAGYMSNNTKIYDMKYYNYPDHKIKLLNSFSHSNYVTECFIRNSGSALCCDSDGYIKEYDLSHPLSLPSPVVFNKIALTNLYSCMETNDKKYIIAGSYQKLFILNAEDGTLLHTLHYPQNGGNYAGQIAEVRQNILVSADYWAASLHDITNIQNIPSSVPLFEIDFGEYHTVIALKSNAGDFAIGGWSGHSGYGFVSIEHLEEDNKTITTLKYAEIIQENRCEIWVIKEIKKGIIIFGGSKILGGCRDICLWEYAAIPSLHHLCWADQTNSCIYDILQVL